MPCFHLEKGAKFLRMENLKNRSATGIAGRCDRAERHKRRLPLFLQSLRNESGCPKSRHFRSNPQIPRTQKSRVHEDPASFICVQQIPLRIWLYRATQAAFSTVGVSLPYFSQKADTGATAATKASLHRHGGGRIFIEVLLIEFDFLTVESLLENLVPFF